MMIEKQMLRPMDNAPVIHIGTNQEIIKMKGCPDCNGRGYFCLNPFAMYNKEYRQCPTCISAKRHYDEYGELPADIKNAMESDDE